MINKYIVVCPNCGTKLITVCSNAAPTPIARSAIGSYLQSFTRKNETMMRLWKSLQTTKVSVRALLKPL